MYKKIILLITLISLHMISCASEIDTLDKITDKYDILKLQNKISFSAFKNAIEGFNKIPKKVNNIITIVDFTKPSNKKRMLVIDLNQNKILLSSYVSHAKRTGELYAKNFSNRNGSQKSCPGFFLTGKVYNGKNGTSLRLYGLQKGVNDNAYKRTIVVHAARYANPSFIKKGGGRLGRSKGCFAVPVSVNKNLVKMIEGGSIFYAHSPKYENINFSKTFKL